MKLNNSKIDCTSLLLAIANDRDESAFKELFYHFYDDLVHFSSSITNDFSSSEDLVADLMLKVWTESTNILPIQNIKTYLFKAIKNSSLNYLNRSKTHEYYLNQPNLNAVPSTPEDLLISKEFIHQFNQLVEKLPPKTKMAFILVKDNLCSYAEAAEIMDISPHTVDRHIQIAVQRLKVELEKNNSLISSGL